MMTRVLQLAHPQTYGSKNPGATNITRKYGLRYGIPVFLFDALKLTIPLLLFKKQYPELYVVYADYCFLAGILGHCYSPFLQYRGGKGVSTFFGGLIVLSGSIFLHSACVWILVFALVKKSALAALCTISLALGMKAGKGMLTVPYFLSFLVILIKHKENFVDKTKDHR